MKNIRNCLLLLLVGQFAYANVTLPRIFGNNMVLQRDMNIPVWGNASPNENIAVNLNGVTATIQASDKGKWKLMLPAMKAGGPYEMHVKGNNEIVFSNVLIGDVWFASGQSNMEFKLKGANNADQEIAAASYPQIRLFDVPNAVAQQPKTDIEGGNWEECSPQTAGDFSAVAYFFGRDIYQDQHVPIGLIDCDWGGTPAEAWTSEAMLTSMPEFKQWIAEIKQKNPDWESDLQANSERNARKQDIINNSKEGVKIGVPDINFKDANWDLIQVPNWDKSFDGIVWLRKIVNVPKEYKKQAIKIDLGRLENMATVYFNGKELGTQYSPKFTTFDVPADLVKSGENIIAVRLLHRWGHPNFDGPAERMKVTAMNGAIIDDLSGTWRYKTGIEPPFPEVIGYQNWPASLYNGMVAPVIPFAIKGVIWYQGESNAGRACQYRTLFPKMIEDWRIRWGEDYFPFLFVQLANYMDVIEQPTEDAWAELRDAQRHTLTLPNTGMAVIIDIGEALNIHPKDKQDVGTRLALAAKKVAYGQDIVYSGPTYESMEIKGNEMELTFDNIGKGMVAKGGPLKGFTIAGEDHKFYQANAQIVGGKVFVSSDQVKNPVAVRYAWASNPVCNLYNKEGLPASPFRTDNWTGITCTQ